MRAEPFTAGEVSATFTKDDGTELADFKKAEADKTVKVTLYYTSGCKTVKTDPYDVTITKAVNKIKINEITVNADLLYNPGAIYAAFDYDISVTYDGEANPGTPEPGSYELSMAEQGGKKGLKVTYTSAVNGELSDFYTSDEVASAVKDFTVKTGDSIGVPACNTSWTASTDIAIPSGKTMVATFKNYGNKEKVWNNFLIEILAGESGITLRTDPYGWNFPNLSNKDLDYTGVDSSGGTTSITADLLNEKNITVIAKNEGTTLVINCSSPDVAGWAVNYTVPLKTEAAKNSLNLHFNIDQAYIVFD